MVSVVPRPRTRSWRMLWVLNQSDGGATLLDIAERSGLPFAEIRLVAERLREAGCSATPCSESG